VPWVIGCIEETSFFRQIFVNNLSAKFDDVPKAARQGTATLLRRVAADMEEMMGERFVHLNQATELYLHLFRLSLVHFNNFKDLESSYASHQRKIGNEMDELLRISGEILQEVGNTVRQHARRGLSRTFPKTLCASPPALLASV
jgi:hypothetical protein